MQHAEISTRVADVAAMGSIGTAAVINLSQINMIIQITAGVVAILAGLAAAAFHMYKTYDLHRERKNR
jgi:hypothetical protein